MTVKNILPERHAKFLHAIMDRDVEIGTGEDAKKKSTAYQFDNFYTSFRPIALLSKFLGAFPLHNTFQRDGRLLKYKLISVETIWSGGLFFAILVLLYETSAFSLPNASQSHGLFWKTVVAYVMFVRAAISFVLCHYGARYLPPLMVMLEIYHEKRQIVISEPNFKNVFKWGVAPVLVTVLSVSIYVYSTCGYMDSLRSGKFTYKGVPSIVFGLLGVWQLVPAFLFTILAFMLISGFNEIYRALQETLPYSSILENIVTTEDCCLQIPEGRVDQIRRLHSLLSLATSQLSDSYGTMLAVDYLVSLIMFVVNIYVFIGIPGQGSFYLLNLSLFNTMVMLIYLNVSHQVNESGHAVLSCLGAVPLGNVSPMCRQEILVFLTQIAVKPMTISAAGFFTIGRAQISSIMGSIATYLIVMIQFTPYLQNMLTKSS